MHKWLCVLLLLPLVACKGGHEGGGGGKGGKKLEYPVETEEVKGRRIEYTVHSVGSLEAFEEVYVIARAGGFVKEVKFKEGDTVKQNQVLVKLDDERFLNARDTAESEMNKANAAQSEAQQLVDNRRNAVKARPEIYSKEEIKAVETKLAIAAADAESARLRFEKAKLDLADTEIKAPVDGVIQSRTVSTNQQLQVGNIVAKLVRRDPMLLRFSVPEQDAARIKTGMSANFTLRDSAAEFTAKVIFVSAQADNKTRMVEMIGQVEGDTSAFKPGAFVQINVPIGTNENAPSIPQTAVRPSDRGFLAFVISGGVAKERVLKLGLRTEDGRVEVLDGIKIGEKVVIRGAEALREGATVKEGGGAAKDGPGASGGKDKGGK